MNQKQNTVLPGITRKDEESHLAYTISVAQSNLERTEKSLGSISNDIHEMLELYGSKDVEALTMWNNTVSMFEEQKQNLLRLEKARKHPYFGRIDFYDETMKQNEAFYIGRVGISSGPTRLVVIDWRAPVATAYYENALGKCSYQVGDGKPFPIVLKLKRTYEIADDKLTDFFDSDVVANDNLLTKYLAKNKKAVLGEIIATIQKEQNEIIRKSPFNNIIVQGVAGSGKTTVAMHRISYILYNYEEDFRPVDFYIIGSNHILLNYITSVLPDLDVYGIRQMTLEQLFVRLLYEDWDETAYRIHELDKSSRATVMKGSLKWFLDLERFCQKLEQSTIPQNAIYLNPRQFTEEFHDGKAAIYDRSANSRVSILLLGKDAIQNYIQETPSVSIQAKILMLNKRLSTKLDNEFMRQGTSYTPLEKKAIRSAFLNRFGNKVWKVSIFELYQDFLKEQAEKGMNIPIPEKSFDVYDLAALAYLYKRVKETEIIREAHHIVIDEAQDFGMMAYCSLRFCMHDCSYTVMGDVSQNIHFGYGLNDWEELKSLLLTGQYDSFHLLKKSYRNTVEISKFAFDILQHGSFAIYPVEPIIRHGSPVTVQQCDDNAALLTYAITLLKRWQIEEGYDTIAVVCRNNAEASRVSKLLGKHLKVSGADLNNTEFGDGIMVLPVAYTKGLEFDAVLLFDPTRKKYPVDDGHAKLLYVAATRALHALCILHTGNLTGLIADPVPENKKPNPLLTIPEDKPAAKPVSVTKTLIKKSKPQTKMQPAMEISPTAHKPIEAPPAAPKLPDIVATTQKPSTINAILTPPAFGDFPPNTGLRPLGHAKIDLAIRWIEKKSDGLYLTSNYGVLRLCAIAENIVRITFSKGHDIIPEYNSNIAVPVTNQKWHSKDTKDTVLFATEQLYLRLEKSTGQIQFMDAKHVLLTASGTKESFQIEQHPSSTYKCWSYFDWQKNEILSALGAGTKSRLPLRGTAKYISHGNKRGRLPLVFSSKGYGILPAANGPVTLCNIPVHGNYIYTEGESQIDFYFVIGENEKTIYDSYCYLTGKNA